MVMTNIEMNVPESMKEYVLQDTTELMRKALLLYPSIVNDTISHGKASELLGISKIELIQLYGKLGIPYFDMSDEEFDEEINVIHGLAGGLA